MSTFSLGHIWLHKIHGDEEINKELYRIQHFIVDFLEDDTQKGSDLTFSVNLPTAQQFRAFRFLFKEWCFLNKLDYSYDSTTFCIRVFPCV